MTYRRFAEAIDRCGAALYAMGLRPGDRLTIESELVELRRASMTFEQRIRRGDELLVTQTISAATVSATGRPIRVPEGLARALGDG